MLTGYGGAQSLSRLADRKREGRILLNVPELCHRIPAPSWGRELREPQVSGKGHGASGTDSRLSVVAALLCGLGCRQFLFNHGCWSHGEVLQPVLRAGSVSLISTCHPSAEYCA